jgi:hypothetical protein
MSLLGFTFELYDMLMYMFTSLSSKNEMKGPPVEFLLPSLIRLQGLDDYPDIPEDLYDAFKLRVEGLQRDRDSCH